jgi:hypothetical protein
MGTSAAATGRLHRYPCAWPHFIWRNFGPGILREKVRVQAPANSNA